MLPNSPETIIFWAIKIPLDLLISQMNNIFRWTRHKDYLPKKLEQNFFDELVKFLQNFCHRFIPFAFHKLSFTGSLTAFVPFWLFL